MCAPHRSSNEEPGSLGARYDETHTMNRAILGAATLFVATRSTTATLSAVPKYGKVGATTVACTNTGGQWGDFQAGVPIYGPFDDGLTSSNDSMLSTMGCTVGTGYVDAGIDTATAESIIARRCIGPSGNPLATLLDKCGGSGTPKTPAHVRARRQHRPSSPGFVPQRTRPLFTHSLR